MQVHQEHFLLVFLTVPVVCTLCYGGHILKKVKWKLLTRCLPSHIPTTYPHICTRLEENQGTACYKLNAAARMQLLLYLNSVFKVVAKGCFLIPLTLKVLTAMD